mmetsp:Transcript_14140/g.22749  ORF Transcript_14140/g.22749 Transcript_14140/m.22749 type:complete len:137 (+) Transcript_14140:472-882(+)
MIQDQSSTMNTENLAVVANAPVSQTTSDAETPRTSLRSSHRRERQRSREASDLSGMMASMMNMAPTPYSSRPVIPSLSSSLSAEETGISPALRLRRMKRRLLLESATTPVLPHMAMINTSGAGGRDRFYSETSMDD